MTPELMEALAASDPGEQALDPIPYGQFLNAALRREGPRVFLHLSFRDSHIGSPGRLHGGVTGAALEFAGMAELMWQARQEGEPLAGLPKPVTLTVDYLRGGRPQDLFAAGEVFRRGRRIASVRAAAWQEDESRPIAAGLLHFLIAPPATDGA